MTDRRLMPEPHLSLRRESAQIAVPVCNLCRAPNGPRDRQLVLGAPVTVLSDADGWSYVQAVRDGYCGHLRSQDLGPVSAPTHRVTALASQAYEAPDIKSRDRLSLSFGSLLTAQSETATFIETVHGFVPRQHVHRADSFAQDPVAIAALFLGTPYLWGGNSNLGIDCSGLIQAAFMACDLDCPADSDMQAASLGTDLPDGTAPAHNDLIFWKGHVALVVDPNTILHANAGHMAVAFETLSTAIARIEAQGDGSPTGHRRHPALAAGIATSG